MEKPRNSCGGLKPPTKLTREQFDREVAKGKKATKTNGGKKR